MGRGRSKLDGIPRTVLQTGSPKGLLVHGVRSPDLPHPGFLKQGKMVEERFAPCRRSEQKQTAREGKTREPKTRPESPGDGPVEEKTVFRRTLSKAALELQNNSKTASGELGNASGSTLGKSQKNPIWAKLRHKKSLVRLIPNFPGHLARFRGLFGSFFNFGAFTWAAGGPNSMESRETCSNMGLSEAFLTWGPVA